MEIYSKYKTLECNVTDCKTMMLGSFTKKNSGKVYSMKKEEIYDCFRSILKYVQEYNKEKNFYACSLKILYDSIQLFFEPLNKNVKGTSNLFIK